MTCWLCRGEGVYFSMAEGHIRCVVCNAAPASRPGPLPMRPVRVEERGGIVKGILLPSEEAWADQLARFVADHWEGNREWQQYGGSTKWEKLAVGIRFEVLVALLERRQPASASPNWKGRSDVGQWECKASASWDGPHVNVEQVAASPHNTRFLLGFVRSPAVYIRGWATREEISSFPIDKLRYTDAHRVSSLHPYPIPSHVEAIHIPSPDPA